MQESGTLSNLGVALKQMITNTVQSTRLIGKTVAFLWRARPGLATAIFISGIGAGVLPALAVAFSRDVLNKVAEAIPAGTASSEVLAPVFVVGGLYVLAVFLADISTIVSQVTGGLFMDFLVGHVGQVMMQRASSIPHLAPFDDSTLYDQIQRLQRDAGWRPTSLLQNMNLALRQVVTLGFAIYLLAQLLPWAAAVLLVTLVPFLLVQLKIERTTWDAVAMQTPERRQMWYYSTVALSAEYAKEVRVFGTGNYFTQLYRRAWEGIFRLLFERRMRYVWLMVSALAVYGVVTAGVYFLVLRDGVLGRFTVGDLAMFIGAVALTRQAAAGLLALAGPIYEGLLYMQMLFNFLDTSRFQSSLEIAEEPKPLPPKLQQGIEFRNVAFRYPGGQHEVLKGVSFRVKPGETIALVGFNGAGKTTLVKLIERLYDPTGGEIYVDGTPLREYDLEQWRRRTAVVFQDFNRYNMTVAENIGLGNLERIQDEEAIRKAAEKAGIGGVVERLPKKYQTVLGKFFAGGSELSGGEWQKVAIARAFLRDAEIVILDEPTAALDVQAELEVFESFAELSKGKITFLISHRFSTVRMADRIVVLENGVISEEGTHADLIRQGGRYAQLYLSQAAMYTSSPAQVPSGEQ